MTVAHQPTMQDAAAFAQIEETMPLMIGFAPNWPVRTVMFRIFGTALILSAAGMWLMPGAQVAADLMLFKFGASLFFFLCGLALLMMHHQDTRPDAYFDPIRQEVRILQKNNRGRPQTVLRRSYESLGSASFKERQLEIFDVDGSLLMRLPLDNAEIRQALRMQLSGAVSIST